MALIVRIVNVSIRGLVLISRFVFLFALVKFLDPAEIGLYGLLVAAIGYSIYFVGLDFYNYVNRKVSGGDRALWGWYIKSQAFLACLLYFSVFPLLLSIFFLGWLPWTLAKWFFVILIFEYLCLELVRFFIAASEQLSASIVLFLNQAFWAVVAVLFMVVDDVYKSLDCVFFFWCAGSISALIYSFFKLKSMRLGGWNNTVDFQWVWAGIKIAVPMLVATLAFRGVFTFDRYLISELSGLEIVAAYVLFIGVAGTLLAFLDAAVFSFSYPALIGAYKSRDVSLFKRNMRIMLFSTIICVVIFVFASLLVFPYLLKWIGKEAYLDNYFIFYWVLFAVVINSLWLVFHYALYAQQLDSQIVYSRVVALVAFLFSAFVFYFPFPDESVLIGLCVSQVVILIWKLYAYYCLTPVDFLGFDISKLKLQGLK
ncbi:Membrane protein involved in the export of O-antigen and teichoic acid [Stutzerimonas kunmingensis]|uniref:hypothetical protein n=1 Tax=Stutzerimonas kunmingensis TaxID=1211807 RepID=UPI0008EE5925|nr:hypothetical protein [Stutzerimonas kunmingensis]MCQ2044497.1 hypothetical protein [Stutzerimonas kunmingensis]SFJ99314.1 Membrane protein involved in the export of O-antigen and teichoic acid [Stutzerimonas kunmingensis]